MASRPAIARFARVAQIGADRSGFYSYQWLAIRLSS
jgi:hypothetical protein